MILGHYIISDHAVDQYEDRVGIYSKMNTRQCIKADLHFSKIKKIVHGKEDNTIHVFSRHGIEFIFKKCKNNLILKTVIKRNRHTNPGAVNKRKMQHAIN